MMSLPVLDKGSSVRIRGYTRSMMPFNLNASVIQSCLTSCTLGELKLIPYQNSRSYLRQPVDVPGDLYRLNDSYLNSPQECQVLDIGVGGARVVSARSYPVGTQLRLGLELLEGSGYMTFPGQVVRVREKSDGRYEYGFLFAQLVKRPGADHCRGPEEDEKDVGGMIRGALRRGSRAVPPLSPSYFGGGVFYPPAGRGPGRRHFALRAIAR